MKGQGDLNGYLLAAPILASVWVRQTVEKGQDGG